MHPKCAKLAPKLIRNAIRKVQKIRGPKSAFSALPHLPKLLRDLRAPYSRLLDRYFDDPEIDTANKTLLALAAYNAGPSRMINLRRKAEQMGYDPNVWFDNVELVAAREVGREPVQYVANIYKYYVAYRYSVDQQAGHAKARQRAGMTPYRSSNEG